MPFSVNNKNLNDIKCNGVNLNKVFVNGVLVYENNKTPIEPPAESNLPVLDTAEFIVKRYDLDVSQTPIKEVKVSNPYFSGIVRGVGNAEILDGFKSREDITVPAGTYILFEKTNEDAHSPIMTHFIENSAQLVTFTEETTITITANEAARALFVIAKVSGVNSIGEYVGTAIEQGIDANSTARTVYANDMDLVVNQGYLVFIKFSGGNIQGGSYSVLLNDTLYSDGSAIFPTNPCYGYVRNTKNNDNHIHIQYQQTTHSIRASMIMIAIPVY